MQTHTHIYIIHACSIGLYSCKCVSLYSLQRKQINMCAPVCVCLFVLCAHFAFAPFAKLKIRNNNFIVLLLARRIFLTATHIQMHT